MLTTAEVRRSFGGAVALFLGRADGLNALDCSVAGFWRSFLTFVFILPLNALTIYVLVRPEENISFAPEFIRQVPALLVSWVAFPIALALAAKPLGISARYTSYVVARNWCAPLWSAILTVPLLFQGAGWLSEEGTFVLWIPAWLIVLRAHYLVMRIALAVTPGVAIALVLADVALSFCVIAIF
ncbi:MAG: hypothetical protein AAGB11_14140 [Pseudomonadota bacterium]